MPKKEDKDKNKDVGSKNVSKYINLEPTIDYTIKKTIAEWLTNKREK